MFTMVKNQRVVMSLVVLLVADMGAFGVPAGLLLMLSILLHELGHALMGRRFGVQTRSIDLHILGGTAFMQELPKKPRHEILIALAGPAVSAALAGLGALGLALTSARLSFGGASWSGVLSFFTAMNLSMTLFNLIPAFPLDGGRVLRAALALRMGPLNATRVAVSLARAIAAYRKYLEFAGVSPMRSVAQRYIEILTEEAAKPQAAKRSANRRTVSGLTASAPLNARRQVRRSSPARSSSARRFRHSS